MTNPRAKGKPKAREWHVWQERSYESGEPHWDWKTRIVTDATSTGCVFSGGCVLVREVIAPKKRKP